MHVNILLMAGLIRPVGVCHVERPDGRRFAVGELDLL